MATDASDHFARAAFEQHIVWHYDCRPSLLLYREYPFVTFAPFC